VQDITKLIAKRLGINGKELEDLQQGALLHDIGKIGIPDRILLKNGPLDDEEWKVMRMHAQIGYDIIKSSPDLKDAAEIVGKHHERWDGTGYPVGLKGEEIPMGARIFAIADSYDAMRSDRPYRKGMSVKESVVEINKNAGTQFDPNIVEIFNELINEIEDVGGWDAHED
jgi:HD-GYP domain-containing protein (c-di-GMP phosphodiesterase class II)